MRFPTLLSCNLMNSGGPRQVTDFAPSELAGLLQRADDLRQLNTRLNALLPAELRPHCQLIRFEAGIAVLRASSSAWATRLSFQTAAITHLLTGLLASDLKGIRIQVRPFLPRKQPPALRPTPLSKNARQCLESAAQDIGDEALAAALRRLARR